MEARQSSGAAGSCGGAGPDAAPTERTWLRAFGASILQTVADDHFAAPSAREDFDDEAAIAVALRLHSAPSASGGRWIYAPADGKPISVRVAPDIDAPRTDFLVEAGAAFEAADERPGERGVLYLRLADGRGWLFDRKPGVGVLCVREAVVLSRGARAKPEAPDWSAVVGALLEDSQRLRQELARERDMRQGRASALRALEQVLRPLRAEVAEARIATTCAGAGPTAPELRARALERSLAGLQEEHQRLLRRSAAAEAEHRQALERRAVGGARAWEGPETEALKVAKVELAELLGAIDEARLERRREIERLGAEVEAALAENARLQERAPGFLASLRRLVTVAAGQADPYEGLEA